MKKIYPLITAFSFIFLFSKVHAQVPTCTTNISPVNLSANVDPYPSVTLKWNAVSGASSYDIYLNSKLPPNQLIGTVSVDSFNFLNASYSTKYYWYIVPKNADGSPMGCASSATTFITSPPPPAPANDNCNGAADISAVPLTGSTLGATQSLPAIVCNGFTGTANDDVWYRFTPASSGTILITLTGNDSFDGVLEVFSGGCGSLTSLTCSDTSVAGGTEQVTMNVIAGTDYKIRIYNFYADLSHRGTFVVSTMDAPLPVTLIRFKGEHLSEKNILYWSTATELNNQGFEVEYATDGTNFKSLSFINSKATNGNSSTLLSYEFTDERSLTGNTYYRLKQVDKNGQSVFSNVILLRGSGINALTLSNIYPNPAKNQLNVTIAASGSNKVRIEIRDVNGKVVLQSAITISNGNSKVSLDVAGLPSGSYFIKAIDNSGYQTSVSKFVKE